MSHRDIKLIIADYKKLVNRVDPLIKVSIGSNDYLDQLEKSLGNLDKEPGFDLALQQLKSELTGAIREHREKESQNARQAFQGFISAMKNRGKQPRESSSNSSQWRIGPVELVIKNQRQFKFRYNEEPITQTWEIPNVQADVEKTFEAACRSLEKSLLRESDMPAIFGETYQSCIRQLPGGSFQQGVKIEDFYKELRITLTRRDISKRSDSKLTYPEFPKWAFLYNLDTYISRGNSVPPEIRLVLGTANQTESSKIGFVTNGLDSNSDYKKNSYIMHRD